MNVLEEIKKQLDSIKQAESSIYLDAILTHLDRATFYYDQGKIDSNFYTDVVYRSNQAYEGALKESYKVLAEKSDTEVKKKTPNDIETYFEENNIFRERVLQLFRNYRQEWRNKSTHDHKLFFDENEAFIALISVSSFTHLLLKHIQEKIAYLNQQKTLKAEIKNVGKISQITESKSTGLLDKVIEIIKGFVIQNGKQISNSPNIKEFEIIGLFHAYIEAINKSIVVKREPFLEFNGLKLRLDLLLEFEGEALVLEFKRFRNMKASPINDSFNQMLVYMQATNTNKSIIYNPNFSKENPKIEINEITKKVNNKTYEIVSITS